MEPNERWTYVEAVDVWIAAVEEQEVKMQELREFAECCALDQLGQ